MCEFYQGCETLHLYRLGDLVIRREIAEIIQKFNNILVLNASISGESLESAWRDFPAVFAIKELENSKKPVIANFLIVLELGIALTNPFCF